jgi:hypothetical protein
MPERPIDDLRDVDALHLLVHPGFGAYAGNRVDARSVELFDRYDRKAAALGPDGMMVALLCEPTRPNGREHQRFVHERISALKAALRGRMIVLSEGSKLFSDEEGLARDFVRAKDGVARARGYWIDEATELVAYGETFGECVPATLRLAGEAYGSFWRTISVHETNMGYRPGETPAEERARFARWARRIPDGDVRYDWTVPDEA